MEDRTGMSRRKIATLILLEMINSKGDRHDKVKAAVDYTDQLLNELKGGRTRDERAKPRRGDSHNVQPEAQAEP